MAKITEGSYFYDSLPIFIIDFGFTSYYQLARKVIVATLLSLVELLVYFQTPISLIIDTLSVIVGTTNLNSIPTSLIDYGVPIESIGPRIPDQC